MMVKRVLSLRSSYHTAQVPKQIIFAKFSFRKSFVSNILITATILIMIYNTEYIVFLTFFTLIDLRPVSSFR